MLSPQQFRRLFSALDRAPHFASCSQGALSDHLVATMHRMLAGLVDTQAPWGDWMGAVEEYRARTGAFLGVAGEHVAVLSSASEGAFQVVSSLDWGGERNRLLTSDLEFPSVGNVWRAQREPIDVVNISGLQAALHAEEWIARIDERTKLVSIPLVAYQNGARPELSAVIEHAHAVGARVFVDAYQGAGVVPFDVTGLGCDYLVTGNLKYLLGLPGIAMLYVRDSANVERPATLTGWFGRVNPFAFAADRVDYPSNARRFEVGTHPIPSVYAAIAGLELLEQVDAEEVWDHVIGLRERLSTELTQRGFTVDTPADPAHRGPQVALVVDDPDGLATHLATHRIGTAPRGRRLRLSVHGYSSDQDIDALLGALGTAGTH